MKVLIDLNVVLDVILQRQPWLNPSQAIWDASYRGPIYGYLVATSLTNCFNIARRVIGSERLILESISNHIGAKGARRVEAKPLPGMESIAESEDE